MLHLGNDWSAEELRDPRARPVRADAVIEVARSDRDGRRVFFIEYDRTRRVDKNYEKFRRYDTFLCWWWQYTSYAEGDRPLVIFVCQDEDQRSRFLSAADSELTGQRWHPSAAPGDNVYLGREGVLFACELDVHAGQLEAARLPGFPPGDTRRGGGGTVRRVPLPGYRDDVERAAHLTRPNQRHDPADAGHPSSDPGNVRSVAGSAPSRTQVGEQLALVDDAHIGQSQRVA